MTDPVPPRYRVALYDDPVFREHDAGAGHPERPERLQAVRDGLVRSGLEGEVQRIAPREATTKELLRVHTEDHVSFIASTRGRTVRIDPDTQASPRSFEAALLAAGAVVDAVDRVLDGEVDRAFCAVRPPGHHAEANRAMGFCLFNNVAVAAGQALFRGLRRVAIVDFDVHHGNGTQAIFYEDPRVLYVSSHQYPFYPGTGSLEETGEGPGRGFTVNLPLPAGAGDAEYAQVYRRLVLPILKAFDAELVLVSAGFDPHRDDPLAGMQLTERGFAELTQVCLEAAEGTARGRTVVALEGGYDLEGIAGATAATVGLLLGEAHRPLEEGGQAQGRLDTLLAAYRRELAVHWPVLAD